jgi:alanyl-tRNA synthetase
MARTPLIRSAAQVRSEFIDFFVERGHRYVPSAPVCPQDDPTLLFTNAGMNQFKDVFLGTGTRPYKRAVNSQKCIRVSGKHNDLEEVGLDTYHHTFFEMLGNWSFGDYFKADAIVWAWELLTGVWGLPKERLWVTVFAGDPADGLPPDDEAARIWAEATDIEASHILRFGRKDNFWEMGETGPCGPCTEIHVDRAWLTGEAGDPRDGADPVRGVNAGNERFIELWNNVFMQFNRLDDGSLAPLPARHVDTGMGFERVLAVLQGVRSNYDTDLFAPLFERIARASGVRYGEAEASDVAFRVIADHVRAVSSAMADGALPSNEGRGYVLRRLVRRASRFGRQRLGMRRPFLFEVVPAVAEVLAPAFPEIAARAEHIRTVVRAEEESFGTTLERGLVLFGELARKVESSSTGIVPGEEAYDLYATYGFPQDLVEQMCRERSWLLDLEGWTRAEERHRQASRSEGAFRQLLSAEQLAAIPPTRSTYHGTGPDSVELETALVRLFPGDPASNPDRLVLEASPFYPEGGGQVGDTGVVSALPHTGASFEFRVEDTRRIGEVVVHLGRAAGSAPPGTRLLARVDAERRARIRANHTATHLLHRALRELLGEHVVQQGSYVGPDRLRFDLSHPRAIEPAELEAIEARVNREIARNAPVGTTVEELSAARERGVMALFGEKYAERVRVVEVPGYSIELCGGTHVAAAGDIGPFLILSERALQAGVRRIEALTRDEAVAAIQAQRRLLTGAARALKTSPEELPARIEALQREAKEARKKSAAGAKADVGGAFERLKGALRERSGVRAAVLDLPELDAAALRELADRARSLSGDHAFALFARGEGRVPWILAFGGSALERGLDAGKLAREIAPLLGGGGGGKPALAQGQGLDPEAVPTAMGRLEEAFAAALGD